MSDLDHPSPGDPLRPELVPVEVADGELRVARWPGPPDGPVVLAAHGVTANLMSFAPLAAALAGTATLVAPDLRGRGLSRDVGPPYSMAHHADDLAVVLEHLGVAAATLLGHSMGGFVAVVAAHRHPDRVRDLVLVDGGLPVDLGAAADLPTEELVTAVIGPAAERLGMTFGSRREYHDFFRDHPAIGPYWNRWVEAYLDHDLVGRPPELRPSCRKEALIGDSESQLASGDVPDALAGLEHPGVFLHVPRGLLDADPLYERDRARDAVDELPGIDMVEVEDLNHYTVMISDTGAARVAAVVRDRL